MGSLLGLVLHGIDTSLGTVGKSCQYMDEDCRGNEFVAYRLLMGALESLATSLLTSLEASWEVPWILSVMGRKLVSKIKDL